jgi:ubiquinone/menaquinone biosynthesis C-methylase UbiE
MNCDRIAPWYRFFEYGAFGRKLEQSRFAFLAESKGAKHALMLGEGDGRFLQEFLRVNRNATVDYVDSSAEMLSLARSRAAGDHDRVSFHHADALVWTPPRDDYDLVVTHFFLDCFPAEEIAGLIHRIASHSPQAEWIVSDFHEPQGGFAAARAATWLRLLYLFFRITTGLRTRSLADYRSALQENGFRLERAITAEAGLLVSELWKQ